MIDIRNTHESLDLNLKDNLKKKEVKTKYMRDL